MLITVSLVISIATIYMTRMQKVQGIPYVLKNILLGWTGRLLLLENMAILVSPIKSLF